MEAVLYLHTLWPWFRLASCTRFSRPLVFCVIAGTRIDELFLRGKIGDETRLIGRHTLDTW